MAGSLSQGHRLTQPFDWFNKLNTLLGRELAPSPHKFRTALRITTIAVVGAGLIASCHVTNELGTYVVWLLVGAGPMISVRKASVFLIAEALFLAASVVMARALAETPWLMLPFIFAGFSLSTYFGTVRKLGASLLLIQVVCLGVFFSVVFAPHQVGWFAAGAFGGSVIAFGVIVVFDNWLWPAPSEANLMESLSGTVTRARSRLLAAAAFYDDPEGKPKLPLPPPTSDLPGHMAQLHNVVAEGVSAHRHAILLAAITRVARIDLEVDHLVLTARENPPDEVLALVRPQLEASVEVIAAVLDEIAHEFRVAIPVGVDKPPPASRVRARSAMAALNARIVQVRPMYIHRMSPAAIVNFGSFTDSLAKLTEHIERLLDEPPQPRLAVAQQHGTGDVSDRPDPVLVRFSLKAGLCAVIGYVVGIFSQHPEMSTVLTTVLITALPSYGATLRKMILRIVGAVIGGAVSLLAVIIVTPNFDTLPSYLIALFIVLYISAYSSLTSARIAYAGKQIGTTYTLVFAGLSPSLEIYQPLWRIWGILVGTVVVAVVMLVVWPVYAGDSLLPKLGRVIRDALALMPAIRSANSEDEIQRTNTETMSILAEILQVADDAQMEGRACVVNHDAIIEAAGTLRRIANRLASIASGRILSPVPLLDQDTESSHQVFFTAMQRHLQAWLDFFESNERLSATASRTMALTLAPDELAKPLTAFSSRVEEQNFKRIEAWEIEQRRQMLAELQSMRRLEYLMSELNQWFAKIPGSVFYPTPDRILSSAEFPTGI
jgi:Fusaric acid resistance protein family